MTNKCELPPSVKERPILFSGPMVNAILDHRKTETRRVIKHRDDRWELDDDGMGGPMWPYWPDYVHGGELDDPRMRCPYGEPGDRLWVREAHQFGISHNLIDKGCVIWERGTWEDGKDNGVEHPDNPPECRGFGREWRMRPSIHMPRWASRINLEVTDVLVQRLQEMNHNDWKADFAPSFMEVEKALASFTGYDYQQKAAQEFWDSINGKTHPWESNPWVWVVKFRRV